MALQIQTLVTQHKHLLDLVTTVAGLSPERDAGAIAGHLAEFGRALTAHLALEDQELYPALRAEAAKPGAPLSLKTRARMFFDEMEGLKPVVLSFLGTWTAAEIARRPEAFRSAFGGLTRVLGMRIISEETRLYAAYSQVAPR